MSAEPLSPHAGALGPRRHRHATAACGCRSISAMRPGSRSGRSSPNGARHVESRVNRPSCGVGSDRADELMDASVAAVADCRAVVVARIGECAINRLDKLGILAFETDDPVDATVRQLADYAQLFEREDA